MPESGERLSLLRPSLAAFTWQVSTWLGVGLVVFSVLNLSPQDVRAMGWPLAMIAAVIMLGELRPIVMTRLVGNPVSISLAFVFAAMYLWGLSPAILLYAASVVLSEVLQRKPLWKMAFNVGQYSVSLAVAWLVMVAAGITPSPMSPGAGLTAGDLLWIMLSWVAYHLVNLALVACMTADDESSWWDDFTDEFWFYTVSTLAVLALSPLVAVVAVAYPYSWTMLPLLLLPLLAVQKAAEMSRQQEHQALHDPLTGLPNRLLLADRIDQALARSSRSGTRVAVMFLDLDLFKVVNDSLGHHAGDALLIEVAERLRSVVRQGDTLARFGGDEFVVVCEDLPTPEVTALSQRIAVTLREPFMSNDHRVSVSASIGVAMATGTSDSHTLLRDADVAMYQAKERGRDQVAMFDETMHRQADERLKGSVGLRRALEAGEFFLEYQPIVEIATGRTVAMEALIRWRDPLRGVLGPDTFIPAAEETGLIVPIGQWVLEEALSQTRRWRAQFPAARNLEVAVNLSARQLLAAGFVGDVERVLRESGLPACAVHLEITESAVMSNLGPVLETLRALRDLGLALAVDDFGTGYSSLAYLKGLPVTSLKVDRSFIAGLSVDASDRPIVDAILKMAQALRLDVIAEGVETPDQLAVLRDLGATTCQGFLWSRPMPSAQGDAWFLREAPTGIDGGAAVPENLS